MQEVHATGGCSAQASPDITPLDARLDPRVRSAFERTNLTQFSDLGLAEPILRAVAAEGYTTPTDIQREAIPAIIAGDDIVGIAQTGTGKTAAFVLPLLHELVSRPARPQPKTCKALILAPTRELAAQIAECVRVYGQLVRPSHTVIVGGVKHGPQIKALARGLDIVIATPGRLLDHMETGALRLDATRTIVLDEADQMLDLGFFPSIRKIMSKMPQKRQTLLLSATMPPPIRELAADFLRHPQEIAVAPVSRPIETIDQQVRLVAHADKRAALVDILVAAPDSHTIVFTRTKRGADRVCQYLEKGGFAAAAIHGDKSQSQRDRALAGFREGSVKVLVATDIAARGIDVDGVTHVINYEMPHVPEAYVHRIGRTARAGASGIAISLVDGDERGLLRDVERLIGRRLLEGVADDPRERSGKSFAGKGRGDQRGPRRDGKPQGEGGKARPARNKPRRERPVHGAALKEMFGGEAQASEAAGEAVAKPAVAKPAHHRPQRNAARAEGKPFQPGKGAQDGKPAMRDGEQRRKPRRRRPQPRSNASA